VCNRELDESEYFHNLIFFAKHSHTSRSNGQTESNSTLHENECKVGKEEKVSISISILFPLTRFIIFHKQIPFQHFCRRE
jgi:hypothetical protein